MGVEPKTRTLKLKNVTVDPTIQPRADGLDQATVEEYAAALTAGATFPPGRVFKTSAGTLWLSRGFHRVAGAQRAGVVELEFEVFTGERRDAVIDAACSNVDHGLKRTNADKRRAIEILLGECPEWSDGRISESASVDPKTVAAVRKECRSNADQVGNSRPETTPESPVRSGNSRPDEPEKRVGKDGKTYPVKPKADPKPVEPTPDETTASGPDDEPEPPTVVEDQAGGGGEQSGADSHPAPVVHDDPTPAGRPVAAVIKPPPAVDAWGIPIQDHATEAFEAVPEFKRLAGLLRDVRGALTALCELPGGRQLLRRCQYHKASGKDGGRWVMAELDNALRVIEDSTPKHTDCPYHFNDLQPHPAPGDPGRPCPLCDGRRFTGTLKQFQVPPDLLAKMKAHYGVEGD
jgi:hypothetical protein